MGRVVEATGSIVGKSTVSGVGQVVRGAESWQFFAFVFGAAVAAAFGLIDEFGDHWWKWRLGSKICVLLFCGYLLVSSWGRTTLVAMLSRWKGEGYFP
jgi:hypothetical protein